MPSGRSMREALDIDSPRPNYAYVDAGPSLSSEQYVDGY
jgi:hypothetical protein